MRTIVGKCERSVKTFGAIGVVGIIGDGYLGLGITPNTRQGEDMVIASESGIHFERGSRLNQGRSSLNLPTKEVLALALRSILCYALSTIGVRYGILYGLCALIVLVCYFELLSIQPRPIDGSVTVDGSVLVERITVPIDPAGELIVRNIRCFRELLGSESACVDVDRGVVLDCSWGIQIVCQANLLGSPFRVNLQVGIGHGFRFEVKRGRTRFILVPTLESVVIRQTGWTIRIGVGLILG